MACTLRTAAAAGLVIGVCVGGAPAAEGQTTIRALRILVVNSAGAPPAVVADAERAAQRIFAPTGIEPAWREASLTASDVPGSRDSSDLASMIIVTLLSPSMEARSTLPTTALGFAVSGSRMASIFYSRIERVASQGAVDLGTLLGHVLAHEIGHLLLPSVAHSGAGIMTAEMHPKLAAQGVLWFSERDAPMLRARVAALDRSHAALVRADTGRNE
jgi:hypothetical protein